MPYFNGGIHGHNDSRGYHPPAPCTAVYCEPCAHAGAVPMDRSKRDGSQHHDSGFRWAPIYGGGRKCDECGGPADGWHRVRDEGERAELLARYGEENLREVPGVGWFRRRGEARRLGGDIN